MSNWLFNLDASAPDAATAWETPDLAVCGHSDAVIERGRVLRCSPPLIRMKLLFLALFFLCMPSLHPQKAPHSHVNETVIAKRVG